MLILFFLQKWDHTAYFICNLVFKSAAAAAKSLQLCPTLCDHWDGSPPGSPIPGILQARTLEWVATSFSNAWKWKVKVKSLSRVQLLATPWTAAHQAPLSMGFSRQEYWSGVPLHLSLNCYKRVFFFLTDVKTNYIWWLNRILLHGLMHRIVSVEEYKNQFRLSSPLNVFHYLVLKLRIGSRTN